MPKLTLRDLFAVVTVVAVLVAWYADHRRQVADRLKLAADRDEMKAEINVLSYRVDQLGKVANYLNGILVAPRETEYDTAGIQKVIDRLVVDQPSHSK